MAGGLSRGRAAPPARAASRLRRSSPAADGRRRTSPAPRTAPPPAASGRRGQRSPLRRRPRRARGPGVEDLDQAALGLAARLRAALGADQVLARRLRQAVAVDLAVRVQRQLRERDPGRGDHRAAAAGLSACSRSSAAGTCALLRHHVGGEGAIALGRARYGATTTSRDGRVGAQRLLDLGRLDAEAADLELAVDAAEELERRRRPAGERRSPVR